MRKKRIRINICITRRNLIDKVKTIVTLSFYRIYFFSFSRFRPFKLKTDVTYHAVNCILSLVVNDKKCCKMCKYTLFEVPLTRNVENTHYFINDRKGMQVLVPTQVDKNAR